MLDVDAQIYLENGTCHVESVATTQRPDTTTAYTTSSMTTTDSLDSIETTNSYQTTKSVDTTWSGTTTDDSETTQDGLGAEPTDGTNNNNSAVRTKLVSLLIFVFASTIVSLICYE